MNSLDICVIGLGYIGLPTASLLANKGHRVRGVDINQLVVDTVNAGKIHIVEPDLDYVVHRVISSGHLRAFVTPAASDVFIIAVPTPVRGREPDMRAVDAATAAIIPHLRPGNLVILESTSPVGATDTMDAEIRKARPELTGDSRVFVAHCPERVLPGQVLRELVDNDRIAGGVDEASTEKAAAFYGSFVNGAVLHSNARTAELAKLVENSYRDVNIAFANELSLVANRFGVNVWELIRLANRHPRVDILRPGPGVGGHCIAVDPWFVVAGAPEEATLIRTAREVNLRKTEWVIEKVSEAASRLDSPKIACLGLAYKPGIDDLRESPALDIARKLTAKFGDGVVCVEPHKTDVPGLRVLPLADALATANIIVALVAHRQFAGIDRSVLEGRAVFDTCGIFE